MNLYNDIGVKLHASLTLAQLQVFMLLHINYLIYHIQSIQSTRYHLYKCQNYLFKHSVHINNFGICMKHTLMVVPFD